MAVEAASAAMMLCYDRCVPTLRYLFAAALQAALGESTLPSERPVLGGGGMGCLQLHYVGRRHYMARGRKGWAAVSQAPSA